MARLSKSRERLYEVFRMLSRRSFLSSSFASASSVAMASTAWRGQLWAQLESLPKNLPARSLFEQDEEAYWRELRKQFLIPSDEIYLNNGTVGSSPDRKSTRLNSSHSS